MVNSRSIQGILVLIVGLFLAVWLGLSIVTNQMETILQVAGASILIICLFLGRRIWLLLPFMAAVGISLRIPGQPSTLLLAQILVLGFSGLLFLMRKLPFKLAWTELETWVLVITLFVFQVYARNPVGVNLFGGDTVGGKPYAIYAIALATGLLLAGLQVQTADLKWILRLSIVGGLINVANALVGMVVPTIAYYTGGDFTTGESEFDNEVVDSKAASRVGFLHALGINLSLWIAAYISPLKALVRPLWGILLLVAIAATMMGGFRNGVAAVGMTLFLGIAYRSGVAGLAIASFGGIAALAMLAVVNTVHPLPPNVQRSLSFLPGTWEQRYLDDTEGSNEWRIEIWREVLLTERWIKNKWLGDGLGFSAAELIAQKSDRKGARAGISGFEAHRESVLASGDYHSGPVTTVRTIGYVGLFFFLMAQIRLAVHAHRQIIRCAGTEWFSLALFVGIPLIWSPPFFVFVFGDFKGGGASFLLAVGMVRLLQNNLPLPEYARGRSSAYQPTRGPQ